MRGLRKKTQTKEGGVGIVERGIIYMPENPGGRKRTKKKPNRTELSHSQPSDVNESCSSFQCSRGHPGSLRSEDIAVLETVTILMESRLFSDTCVSFAEHLPIGLIVFVETRCATRVPTNEVFWMVFGTRVCYRTWSFNGLPTRRGSTQRTVCFVIVVGTIRTTFVDVE